MATVLKGKPWIQIPYRPGERWALSGYYKIQYMSKPNQVMG